MENIINMIEIALIIILPLIIFYQILKKKFQTIFLNVVFLYLIWFGTYALFHELCHLFGSWITGAEIRDFQLIPHFWEGEYKTGYVNSVFKNRIQSFISPISPYFRDIILLLIGYVILRKKNVNNSFVTGLLFILFILSSLFDVFNNYFAFVIGYRNDFYAIMMTIGKYGTHTIGLFFIVISFLILRKVFLLYKSSSESKLNSLNSKQA